MLIFDAHLDLSMNAIDWNRDLTRPATEIRAREAGQTDKPDRSRGTVSLPDMRRGQIGLCVATMIARYVKPGSPLPGWHSPEIAWAQTQGQLAWYRAMEEAGELTPIRNTAELNAMVELWQKPPAGKTPIGYVLSLEGADSIRTPDHLQRAYEQGLRAIGPAHYGDGRYAQGTHAEGGLRPQARELLKEMERLNIILDATHLNDECFWQALDIYQGPVWASHNNCRALVPDTRQFTDEQLKALIARGAVIGAVLDAWMLIPGWIRGKTTPEETQVTLEQSVDHIDRICQLAGSAKHCGIGSDLDGGYGREQSPLDIETISDLGKYAPLLERRGYSEADIRGIMHGNWIRFLGEAWGRGKS
jgi:membrane dipeptidase